MRVIQRDLRPVCYVLVLAVFSLLLPCRAAEAELAGTRPEITLAHDGESARARVRALLDRQDVQAKLQSYGISVEEARARVESLRDDEIGRVARKLDQLPAGGDAGLTVLFAAVFAATIVVLVGVGLALWYFGKWTVEKLSDADR